MTGMGGTLDHSPAAAGPVPTRARRKSRALSGLDILFAISIASLFLDISYPVGPMKLRPFDPLAVAALFAVAGMRGLDGLLLPTRILPHVLFLGVSALSALSAGPMNGLREGLQGAIAFGFVIAMISYFWRRDPAPCLRLLAKLIVAIVLFNIGWHLANGFYFGWKRLDDPKTAFLLLPAIVSAAFSARGRSRSPLVWGLAALAFVGIVMSGERKAYLVGVVALVLAFGPFSPRLFAAAALLALGIGFAVTADPGGYLQGQIDSLLAPDLAQNWAWFTQTDVPKSFSNAQRAFAFETGMAYFAASPLTGVGTNVYFDAVRARFAYLPDYLTIGIHGEFLRTLVENGVIGFGLYVLAWLTAARRLVARVGILEWFRGLRGPYLTQALIFAACLSYTAFESAKTLSILAFLLAPFVDVLFPAPGRQPAKPSRSRRLSSA